MYPTSLKDNKNNIKMRNLSLVLACALIGLTFSSSTPQWSRVDDIQPADNHHFNFKIAFKKQNVDVLDSLFWQITDYYSPLFGRHLSNQQIKELVSLPEESIAQVEAYLRKESGKFCDVIVRRSVHQDYLFVDTCVAQANIILPNLNLAVYQKEGTGNLILRHSIMMDVGFNMYLLGFPQQLQENIEGIYGVTDLPIHYRRVNSDYPDGGPFDPSKFWQPTVEEQTVDSMIKYFGISYDGIKDSSYSADNAQVRQGVVEFNHAPFSASGLADFQNTYHVPLNPVSKIIGTEEHPGSSIEADLDFQTITALSGKAQTWDFVFGPNATFNDVVETILSTDGAPKVYSCSWGGIDTQFTQTTANSINQDFLKLGLTGVSFFIAAGDAGPTLNGSCDAFDAQFPGSSVYVIAVGGTVIDGGKERCWERSSGGFSSFFQRPSFQDNAVNKYLSSTDLPANPNQSIYNTTGRAYPDVSAIGAFEPVFNGSQSVAVGGTSGASPQFAAIATLINIHRFQQGKGPVGPLNKTLYQLPKGIGFDVTTGRTYATSANGTVDPCPNFIKGFFSAPGWDAATGLGSPRFDTLLEQLLEVPGEKMN
mmetsp:Transcript_13830/g.15296  ORF Transcript_13830/g.15296 Transcript_13830/m.15296 type:complete len:593 (-) Transcript_13830:287-2065(-)